MEELLVNLIAESSSAKMWVFQNPLTMSPQQLADRVVQLSELSKNPSTTLRGLFVRKNEDRPYRVGVFVQMRAGSLGVWIPAHYNGKTVEPLPGWEWESFNINIICSWLEEATYCVDQKIKWLDHASKVLHELDWLDTIPEVAEMQTI